MTRNWLAAVGLMTAAVLLAACGGAADPLGTQSSAVPPGSAAAGGP